MSNDVLERRECLFNSGRRIDRETAFSIALIELVCPG